MIEIEVNNDSWYNINSSFLENFKQTVHSILGISSGTVSLALVSNEQIQLLNKMYYGRDEPTDVLSFAEQELGIQLQKQLQSSNFIGEILIAPDVMQMQAPRYNNSIDQEFLRLLVHGFLHLLGYDHAEPSEAKIMKAQEDELLKEMS